MSYTLIRLPFFCTFLALSSLASTAATLDAVRGDILVNKGKGFRPASGTIELAPGDLVISNPGSSAIVRYGSSCSVNVVPGAVVAITQNGPCAKSAEPKAGKPTTVATRPPMNTEGLMRLNPPGSPPDLSQKNGPDSPDGNSNGNANQASNQGGNGPGNGGPPAGDPPGGGPPGGGAPGGFFAGGPGLMTGLGLAAAGGGLAAVVVKQVTNSNSASP